MGNVYSLSRCEYIFEYNENENSIFSILRELDEKIYQINRQHHTSVRIVHMHKVAVLNMLSL
jgi:hypothetical protein